jgi:hypothetical protein
LLPLISSIAQAILDFCFAAKDLIVKNFGLKVQDNEKKFQTSNYRYYWCNNTPFESSSPHVIFSLDYFYQFVVCRRSPTDTVEARQACFFFFQVWVLCGQLLQQ